MEEKSRAVQRNHHREEERDVKEEEEEEEEEGICYEFEWPGEVLIFTSILTSLSMDVKITTWRRGGKLTNEK